jgi:hypothetical protein
MSFKLAFDLLTVVLLKKKLATAMIVKTTPEKIFFFILIILKFQHNQINTLLLFKALELFVPRFAYFYIFAPRRELPLLKFKTAS